MEIKWKDSYLKIVLTLILVSIWVVIIQNTILINDTKKVDVMNDIIVHGHVGVSGEVEVTNEVDINLSSINGYDDCFFDQRGTSNGRFGFLGFGGGYYRIPVYTGF